MSGDYHDYPQGMEPKRQRTAYTRHQMLELEKVKLTFYSKKYKILRLDFLSRNFILTVISLGAAG